MSNKNQKSKRFVIIMSVVVILIIIIGTWLTWEIIKDGMDESMANDNLQVIEHEITYSDYHMSWIK